MGKETTETIGEDAVARQFLAQLGAGTLQHLVAAQHQFLQHHRLDRMDAGDDLEEKTGTPVIVATAVPQPALDGPAEADRQKGKNQQQYRRDQNQFLTDQIDQDQEDKGKGQIEQEQQGLAGVKPGYLAGATEPLGIGAGLLP